MKKILAALVLLMYFTVSTGFVVSMHYCMDKFDSAQLGASHDDTCDKCGMENGENNCCRDEVQVVKLQTSHLVSALLTGDSDAPLVSITTDEFLVTPFFNYDHTEFRISHSPPLINEDIYIENRVFRI